MAPFPANTLDIQTAQAAQDALQRLAPEAELAVDLEVDAMHAFRARLCFVQLAGTSDIFLFDTLSTGVGAGQLAPLLGGARTVFIHAAGEDLKYLAEAGVRVKGLFDTHRAVTLLGWPKVGLADLARSLLEIELPKEHQQSDFSLRPLPSAMREYIANDVRYLREIGQRVRAACQEADILEEVLLDCERLSDESVGRPAVAPFSAKLPRTGQSPQSLARAQFLATALHERRLAWAEAANVPMGRMLSNAAITAIAIKVPADLRTLSRCEGVRGAFAREHGEEVLALVREATDRAARGELEPAPAAQRDSRTRRREEKLRVWRTAKALERKVTPSVVLPNASLEELARSTPVAAEALQSLPYFGPKRLRLYGDELAAMLASDG